MVSPSKVQEQKQPSRENKSDRRSHVRIQKGLKPLEKKSFYLDIKNHATAAKLEARIKELGGIIEVFLVRSVSLVITDRVEKASNNTNSERHKWGCASGGSRGPPSLRSIEVPTPTPTPPTPFLSSECPLSNSANPRGQTTQRSKSRVDAMLERALTQPQQCSVDPLDNAQSWGIPIWATDKLQAWLDKIYASFKNTNNLKHLKRTNQHSSGKDLKVKHLKIPYIKFESFNRGTRPVFLELSAWPTLNYDGDPGSCPFDSKKRDKPDNKLINKEVKENREDTVNKEKEKEMTRRPRAARARRTEQLVAGYCEICRIDYRDLSKHVQSDQHLNFVRNDDNFLSLDKLIDAGASVEAFLKLNRTKDIEKDCNLFSNGDRNIHNVVLPEEKVNKNSKSLNSFDVDEIKMVQCNGTRRNISLKLNSPHNLRARAKHESGHLLRSKGSPWHEFEKNEKLYDKLEGFTIKKRSKGTIWIEEEDPDEKYLQENEIRESKQDDFRSRTLVKEIDEVRCELTKNDNIVNDKCSANKEEDLKLSTIEQHDLSNSESLTDKQENVKDKENNDCDKNRNSDTTENIANVNGLPDDCCIQSKNEAVERLNYQVQSDSVNTKKLTEECDKVESEVVCNGHDEVTEQKDFKTPQNTEKKDEKPRCPRTGRRGGRSYRGRHRLSVEERLIEDNRAYYKVEVLGSKLRSSASPGNTTNNSPSKTLDGGEKKEMSPAEKPVVVRFKRVRKSELSLLSDEAESFMFGEPKRDDSSEISDGEQSSVLPKDTESEGNETATSMLLSSPVNSSSPSKQEITEEDSQDSTSLGRARKRRRTQAEALIKDNADYYKFETPGSRLRYQAPLTGIKESLTTERVEKSSEPERKQETEITEKIYPSKPSPEVEKMQFSFEAIPKSEPWYQTYQRQDEGAEFWHYFSEGDTRKPFLLPYEIENFHETLMRNQARSEGRKKGRGRSTGCMGRSPRKSPRCHASTLAIMSTIIRKREQQQQTSNLCTIEEYQSLRSQADTPGPEQKHDSKADVDEELKEMAKNIDEMLSMKSMELDDSFEPDVQIESNFDASCIPKGPPPNLLELLDNCQDIVNCLENSSCASSECGDGSVELPLKRRKKRKNRTGWPGIKMRKKLQNKPLVETSLTEVDTALEKQVVQSDDTLAAQVAEDISNRVTESSYANTVIPEASRLQPDEDQSSPDKQKNVENSETCTANVSLQKSRRSSVVRRGMSIELADDAVSSTIHDSENRMESLTASEVCSETERNVLSNKEYTFRKDPPNIEQVSENEPSNDENHENVNTMAIIERNFNSKSNLKKRQRENTSSDACEQHAEIENQDILCVKDAESGIVPRKHHSNEVPKRRQSRGHSENPVSELDRHVYRRRVPKKRIYSRKRQKRNSMSTTAVYDDENCKKDSYLSINCKKQQNVGKTMKRRSETVATEAPDHPELECALSERVSPAIISSELEQRRSSIEFQPVVRMMKIEDQVDVDHSILSVTVASNRRLRSSGGSPRSNTQPPRKRLKTGRGSFGRWLKSS